MNLPHFSFANINISTPPHFTFICNFVADFNTP